jgi:hypothetical protein
VKLQVHLLDGDRVVVTPDQPLTDLASRMISTTIAAWLRGEHKVLVLRDGAELVDHRLAATVRRLLLRLGRLISLASAAVAVGAFWLTDEWLFWWIAVFWLVVYTGFRLESSTPIRLDPPSDHERPRPGP